MYKSSFISIVGTITLHACVVNAFWRLLCDGSIALARIDPLLNYGGVSDHVHSIKGGSAFTSTSSTEDLAKSKCSSCDVKEDNSVYWAPALYFMNSDDNTVEVVAEKPPHKSYYFLNTGLTSDGKQQKIEAFPKGFQMISGQNRNRNSSIPDPDPNPLGPWPDDSQDLRAERALGFNCLNYAKGEDEPSLFRHFLPEKSYLDANCPDGVRLELMFPSCWNGELDGGIEHNAHVAFPDGVMTGNCPKGFDRRIVSLFYETIVATDQYKDKNGKFVFANGDPTGYGYHGDFMEAWAPGVLQNAVDQCTGLSGDMRECPFFSFHSDAANCAMESPLPAQIATEKVKGPIPNLPNNIQIQPGPEPATKPAGSSSGTYKAPHPAAPPAPQSSASAQKVPTVSLKATSEISETPSPAAGSIVEETVVHHSSLSSSVSPSLTVSGGASGSSEPSTTPVPTQGPDAETHVALREGAVSTAYVTSGRVLNEVIVVLEEVTVTDTGSASYAKRTAGPELRSFRRRHDHHHHHHQHVNAAHGIGSRR